MLKLLHIFIRVTTPRELSSLVFNPGSFFWGLGWALVTLKTPVVVNQLLPPRERLNCVFVCYLSFIADGEEQEHE